MNALSAQQIKFFKEYGYLALEDFIEPVTVDAWRRSLADFLGTEPDHPESWDPQALRRNDEPFRVEPKERALRNLPQMRSALEQLGGGHVRGGTENLITRWPEPDKRWKLPHHGHIDLILLNFNWRFTLGATTYLYEVEPQGGAFCVWPGTHTLNWQYFQQSPGCYFSGSQDTARHQMEEKINARIKTPPLELTGRPGTVFLWHSFLLHEASRNVRPSPRVAFFYRWGEPVENGTPVESFGDLWEHWAI
ncbi:MAG TPA: phytanoyl-CoA dioxygenase family protein [Thermoanaerobaculia bacterium]|jgi:ectoine hydroxylase-related dioxygenase (phytanoyl-CoA dioxygenase family)|nr:phytanoyl-CoA dioxygenase family protein [Thermoanaerobaculia bacterium]